MSDQQFRQAYDALIEQAAPRVLSLGDRHLIAEPEAESRPSSDTTFKWRFYEYRAGKVVRVPVTDETSE